MRDPAYFFKPYFYSALDNGDERLMELYNCRDTNNCIYKFRNARKMISFKNKVYGDRGYSDVIITYKDLEAKSYVETPILSLARGTVVRVYGNEEYRTLALPFAKFFNYREIRGAGLGDPGRAYYTEKLDGTLIIVWRDPDTGELRYNTRGMLDYHAVIKGKTGVYVEAKDEIANPFIRAFIHAVKRMGLWHELEDLVKENRTVMFELTCKIPASMDSDYVFKLPLDDPSYKPYLLGYRDNEQLVYPILEHSFPTPRTVHVRTLDELLEYVRENKDAEGVVGYDGGLYDHRFKWWDRLVKFKNTVYVLRAMVSKDQNISWKKVASASIGKYYDDLVSLADNTEVVEFAKQIRRKYNEMLGVWSIIVDKTRQKVEEKGWGKVIREYRGKNLGYMVKYIGISVKHGYDAGLKILLKDNMPSGKEKILKFMERLHRRLEKIAKML